ncbi:MAG: hypothetical protein AAFP91_17325 [Pseudomonadota bacterium]
MKDKEPPPTDNGAEPTRPEDRAAKDALDLIEKAAPLNKLKASLEKAKRATSKEAEGTKKKTRSNDKRKRRQF